MKRRRLIPPVNWKLEKVISGGQIGADIAGVRAAKVAGIPTGGYMPVGWITYNGLRPEYEQEFGMIESLLGSYRTRTWLNVEKSDGTVRIAYNFGSRGEICTMNAVRRYGRPCLDIAPSEPLEPYRVACWLRDNGVRVLNVAGNADEALEVFVESYLGKVFKCLKT